MTDKQKDLCDEIISRTKEIRLLEHSVSELRSKLMDEPNISSISEASEYLGQALKRKSK